jgi:hypothetical protein
VVVSAAIDLHRLAVGSEQAHALAALDLADARDRMPSTSVSSCDALARIRVRGEAELVVVAAGDDRVAARVVPMCFAPIDDTGTRAARPWRPRPTGGRCA